MSESKQGVLKTIAAIAFLVVVAIVGVALVLATPVGCIWAANTLFGAGIPITWKTVAAALVLMTASRRMIGLPRTAAADGASYEAKARR